MKTPAEIVAGIETFYDRDTLELEIRYCKAVVRATTNWLEAPENADAPDEKPAARNRAQARPRLSLAQAGQCIRQLSMFNEALRLQTLLVKSAANKALGDDSPYVNDGYLTLHNEEDIYRRYCDLRLGIQPRASRARRRPATRDETLPRTAPRQSVARAPRPAPDPAEEQAKQELVSELVDWTEKTHNWLDKGDPAAPLPELRADVVQALEHDAKFDPECAKALETLRTLSAIAMRARQAQQIAKPRDAKPAGPGGARRPTAA
jgi:hypothetical protein